MPVFYVYVKKQGKNIEISELIEKFSFDDSTEKDNFLQLTIFSKFAETFDERDEVATGDEILFSFGFLGGQISKTHTCVVKEIVYNYGDRVTISVKALDKGNEIKRTIGGNLYQGKTAKTAIQEIAKRNGLTSEIENGDFDISDIAQGNKSDLDFVKHLASLEPSGIHIAYVRNKTLYYVAEGNHKKARKAYDYKNADGGIIKFSSNFSEASPKAQGATSTTAASFDPLAKKSVSVKADAKTETTDAKTGNKTVNPSTVFNQNADVIGKKIITPPANKGTTTAQDKNTGVANSEKKAKILKASLTVELDPLIEPNDIITISGVFKRDVGNWLIVSVAHEIGGSGGITTMQLSKNGTNQNKGIIAKKVNKTVGADKTENKRVVFNQNAERK